MKEGLFNRDEMMQHDCPDEESEDRRVEDYNKWKETRTGTGHTNETNMRMWSEINLEFKRRGVEGRPQSIDSLRRPRKVVYD